MIAPPWSTPPAVHSSGRWSSSTVTPSGAAAATRSASVAASGTRAWRAGVSMGEACRIPATVHQVVNDPFKALAHPIRRGIVERLPAGPAPGGGATAGFGVSKPAISKHLKVLEETGVVTRTVEGRTHRLSLQPAVMTEAADWMDRQRALWGRMFDVVDEYLKESR